MRLFPKLNSSGRAYEGDNLFDVIPEFIPYLEKVIGTVLVMKYCQRDIFGAFFNFILNTLNQIENISALYSNL